MSHPPDPGRPLLLGGGRKPGIGLPKLLTWVAYAVVFWALLLGSVVTIAKVVT